MCTHKGHVSILDVSLDQCWYLSSGAPSPPLMQQQLTNNKLGLILVKGRDRCTVSQILTLICLFEKRKLSIIHPMAVFLGGECSVCHSSQAGSHISALAQAGLC